MNTATRSQIAIAALSAIGLFAFITVMHRLGEATGSILYANGGML